MMQRLFVAIRPPDPVRDRLLSLMGGISGARWQTDEQLHLTLRFIGEVDRHVAEDVDAALGAVHHPPFEIALRGLGTFERRGQPAVVWAGLAPQEPVRTLHKKIDQALARVGIEPDRQSYHPHITLARLKRGAGPVQAFVEQPVALSGPAFRVDRFGLFESKLTPEGAFHSEIATYPLG